MMMHHLVERELESARIMVNAVNYKAETASSINQIQRFVSALGADPGVSTVTVVGGLPTRVISCTR